MNRASKFIVQCLFYGLVGGLLFYAASRTLSFVQNTMPSDRQYLGYLYLLATGIGAVIWLAIFLSMAEGAKQRGISFAMGIIDLLAELVLVYADTVRVSAENQMMVMNTDEMQIFVFASVGAVGMNILAGYFFKLFDPGAEMASKARDLVDEVSDAAMKQLNTPTERQRMIAQLSPTLGASILAEVTEQVYQMSGKMLGDNEYTGLEAERVAPGLFPKQPPAPPKEAATGFFDRIKLRNPFRPAPKAQASANYVPTQDNPSAVWTVNEDGSRRKIFCLACFHEGKPWTNPEPCEHILKATGQPAKVESSGAIQLPENMPQQPQASATGPANTATN